MNKKITAVISSIALFITACQPIIVEGKSINEGLLSVKQTFLAAENGSQIQIRGGSAKADSQTTITVDSADLYSELVKGIKTNDDNPINEYGDNKKFAINMDAVESIEIDCDNCKNMTQNDTAAIQTLVSGCKQLKNFKLYSYNAKWEAIDFSGLSGNNNLTDLELYNCALKEVPDLSLPNLDYLSLSKNKVSADSLNKNLTKAKLPKLTKLYLELCGISDVSFIGNLGGLKILSLSDDHLNDDSLAQLLAMKDKLSGITNLYIGKHQHKGNKDIDYPYGNSINKFTDFDNIALLANSFTSLTELDLSGLRITSLEPFKNVIKNINIIKNIDFTDNMITDFAGLEYEAGFKIEQQVIDITGFAGGWRNELPEDVTTFLTRILDENDVLHGTLRFEECSMTDDNKFILLDEDPKYARVAVNKSSVFEVLGYPRIIFTEFVKLKKPELPDNLTAMEGDTLAQVELPEGFTWNDAAQDVGTVGVNTFQAVYTKQYNSRDYFWDVELPVTVSAPSKTPAPQPTIEPTKVPASETPAKEPTKAPATETPAKEPTKAPASETPKIEPTKAPATETPTIEPTKAPATETPTIEPTKAPATPKPDESKLTGNQIEKRTDLPILLAVGKQKGKNSIRMTWNKWKGCTGYEVYWSYCDGKQNFKKLKTVKSNAKRVCVHKKLKRTRAYKYYIATYRIKNGRKNYLSKSQVIHVAMKKEKNTNAKKIKLNKTRLTLKRKKTFQIKATVITENRKKKLLAHEPKIRYYTGNKEVATVSKKGKIKAKKKGTCTIYVIANNGVAKTIKVTVK